MFLQKDERDFSLTAELDEMRPFLCRFGKKRIPLFATKPYRITPRDVQIHKTSVETIASLEFVKFRTVDQTGNHVPRTSYGLR